MGEHRLKSLALLSINKEMVDLIVNDKSGKRIRKGAKVRENTFLLLEESNT